MLTTALLKIKEALSKNKEPNPEILIPQLSKEFNVLQDDLVLYYNLLADAKRLRNEKGQSSTKMPNWFAPEENLVYHFVSSEMSRGVGVHEAVENIASVLDRNRGGVQTKFYQIRKIALESAKVRGDEIKAETRGRKKKKADTPDSIQDNNTGSSEVLQELASTKTTLTADNTNKVIEEVGENNDSNKVIEEVTANSDINKSSEHVLTENEDIKFEQDNNEVSLYNSKTPNNYTSSQTSINLTATEKTEPVEDLDVVTLINRLINNMDTIGKVDANFDSNGLLVDLLRGLYVLSDVAAKNLMGGMKYQEAQRKLESLEKEKLILLEDVQANADLVHQKDEEIRKLYLNMQERVDEFENLDPKEKLAGIGHYHTKMKYQLNKYSELSLLKS